MNSSRASDKKIIKSLSWQAVFFLSSNTIIKLIGFLVLPIYTAYLSAESYGTLSIYENIKVAFGFLSSFLIEQAYVVYFSQNKKDNRSLFVSFLAFVVFWNLLAIPAFSLLAFSLDIIPENSLRILFIITVSQFLWQVALLFYAHWKNIYRSVRAATAELICYLLSVAGTLVLLIPFNFGWQSQLYATLVVSSFQLVVILGMFLKNRPEIFLGKIDFGIILKGLKMGGSLVLPTSLMIMISLVDKMVLNRNVSLGDVGFFNLASKFLLILVIGFEAFLKVFEPFLYDSIRKGSQVGVDEQTSNRCVISDFYSFLFFFVTFTALCLAAFSRELIYLGFDPAYRRSFDYIIGLAPAFVLYAMARCNFSIIVIFGTPLKTTLFLIAFIFLHYGLADLFTGIFSYRGIFLADFLTMLATFVYLRSVLKKKFEIKIDRHLLFLTLFTFPIAYGFLYYFSYLTPFEPLYTLMKILVIFFYLAVFFTFHAYFQKILSLILSQTLKSSFGRDKKSASD